MEFRHRVGEDLQPHDRRASGYYDQSGRFGSGYDNCLQGLPCFVGTTIGQDISTNVPPSTHLAFCEAGGGRAVERSGSRTICPARSRPSSRRLHFRPTRVQARSSARNAVPCFPSPFPAATDHSAPSALLTLALAKLPHHASLGITDRLKAEWTDEASPHRRSGVLRGERDARGACNPGGLPEDHHQPRYAHD